MPTTTPSKWEELRKPFPPETIGKLPKGGIMLDYIGHANITDRLLQVDPNWNWEPLATNELGLPALDSAGNLWIKLTVLGVTRIGVGDGKNAKECIGDALRNAAMRFGVALDLWSKEELESHLDHPELKNEKPTSTPTQAPVAPQKPSQDAKLTAEQVKHLMDMAKAHGFQDRDSAITWINQVLTVDDFTDMPQSDYMRISKVIATTPKGDFFGGDEPDFSL